MVDIIEIETEVTKFLQNTMHDDFENGEFASYHASILKILSPIDLKNKKITIYHDSDLDQNSPWRKLNQKLKFSVKIISLVS